MLTEHGVEATSRGDQVELTGLDLHVTAQQPRTLQPDVVEVPIGIRLPELGQPAWDQAAGMTDQHNPALVNALTCWLHHVLPLFVALRDPEHPLAANVDYTAVKDSAGARTQVLTAPTVAPTDVTVAYPPPALSAVRKLLKLARAATLPVWVSAVCTRTYEQGKTYEVKANNFPVTDDVPGFGDAVTWGDHQGTVKQWAVFRVMPN
ncbi:hypothetical protein GCM10029964_112900 [Kibdelosporangium lantanae]